MDDTRLVKSEKMKMINSCIMIGFVSVQIAVFIVIDWTVYWVIKTIMYYDVYFYEVQDESESFDVHINGDNIFVKFLRNIIDNVKPAEKSDTIPGCLLTGSVPDLKQMALLMFLLVVVCFMGLAEPYGLRIRQLIMATYHPDISQRRASWLYSHILTSRKSFLVETRRFLRRRFTLSVELSKNERIGVLLPFFKRFSLLRNFSVYRCLKKDVCYVCDEPPSDGDDIHYCPNKDCKGTYCTSCFTDLNYICTICMHPLQYGDLSDISEEIDSSDSETISVVTQRFKDKQYNNYLQSNPISEESSYDIKNLRCEEEEINVLPTLDGYTTNSFTSGELNISTRNFNTYKRYNYAENVNLSEHNLISLSPERCHSVLFIENLGPSDPSKSVSVEEVLLEENNLNLKNEDSFECCVENAFSDTENNDTLNTSRESDCVTRSSGIHEHSSVDVLRFSSLSQREKQLNSSSFISCKRTTNLKRPLIASASCTIIRTVSSSQLRKIHSASLHSKNNLPSDKHDDLKLFCDSNSLNNLCGQVLSGPVIPKKTNMFDNVIREYKLKYDEKLYKT